MHRIIYWDCESFWGMYPLKKDIEHFENINYVYKELYKLHKKNKDIQLLLSIVGLLLCSSKEDQFNFLRNIKRLNMQYKNIEYNNRIDNLLFKLNKTQNLYINKELKAFSKLKHVKIGNHTSTHPYIKKNESNFDQLLLNEIYLTDEKIKSELDLDSEFVILPQNKINDSLALELSKINYSFRPSNIKWEYDENLESNGKLFKIIQKLKRIMNIVFPIILRKDPTRLDGTQKGQMKCGIFLRLPNNIFEYKILLNFYKHIFKISNDKVFWLHPHNFLKNTQIKLRFYSNILELMNK